MPKIYECLDCHNLVLELKKGTCPIMCCGKPLAELIPNTHEGAGEKHVPVVSQEGNIVTVKVGSVAHPMMDAHYIEWIGLETNHGFKIANLKPGVAPEAKFALLDDEEVVLAYAYCNLHGLWSGK